MSWLLNITTTPIKLEHNITHASQEIQQFKPEFTKHEKRPELRVQTDHIKFKIDQTETFESMGIYTSGRFFKKLASDGMQAASEATARYSEEGRRMMDSKQAMFPELGTERFGGGFVETELAFIPNVRPTIEWTGGTVDVDFTPNEFSIEWKVSTRPEVKYNPYKVDISVSRFHDVDIEYTGTVRDSLVLTAESAERLCIKV